MSIKHYFANKQITEKFALGKSADISQNVRLELFQNLKKSYMGLFLTLKGPSSTLCVFPLRTMIYERRALLYI